MPRYFFHTADGQRCVDRVGTELIGDSEAKREAVVRAGRWITSSPNMLISGMDCRMEVSLEDNVTIFSIIMFSADPRSFGKGH